jgi:hypothetical protein
MEDAMPSEEVRRDTLRRAQALTRKEVLDELKRQGVNNLNELVDARLEEVKKMGQGAGASAATEERGSVLIYKCFILADWE